MTLRLNGATLFGILVLVVSHCASAAEHQPAEISSVMMSLQAAKSNAEEGVHVLKTYARGDATTQVEGVRLYRDARAAFNGFIVGLVSEKEPEAAVSETTYQTNLQDARDKEKAFLVFVQEKTKPPSEGGKAAFADLLEGVSGAFEHLVHAGIALRQEITREPDAQRERIRKQLEDLKWQQFANVP